MKADSRKTKQELVEELKELRKVLTLKEEVAQKLRVNELRFKAVLDSAGYGYYETDEYGTFTYVNQQISEILGYSTSEIVGTNYREFTDDQEAKRVYKAFDEVFKNKNSLREIEHHLTSKDGRIIYIHISISLLLSDIGEPIGFNGLVHEITSHKENEKRLIELNKNYIDMAHAAGMADMASNTLHNVGNVLNSVKVSAQIIATLLREEPHGMENLQKANEMLKQNLYSLEDFILNDKNGKKLIEYVSMVIDDIMAKNRSVDEDINRLLQNVSLIESVVSAQQTYAGLGAHSEMLSLAQVVKDALVLKSALLEKNSIIVKKNFENAPKIMIQKSKLIHIIINIINNAVDAMVDKPTADRFLHFSISKKGSYTTLVIQDSGKGIEKENLNSVFKHGYTTKQYGHGFGLHSSASYMQIMNGRIWAESQGLGKGASFYLQFAN